jgi:hypothetical protein
MHGLDGRNDAVMTRLGQQGGVVAHAQIAVAAAQVDHLHTLQLEVLLAGEVIVHMHHGTADLHEIEVIPVFQNDQLLGHSCVLRTARHCARSLRRTLPGFRDIPRIQNTSRVGGFPVVAESALKRDNSPKATERIACFRTATAANALSKLLRRRGSACRPPDGTYFAYPKHR